MTRAEIWTDFRDIKEGKLAVLELGVWGAEREIEMLKMIPVLVFCIWLYGCTIQECGEH